MPPIRDPNDETRVYHSKYKLTNKQYEVGLPGEVEDFDPQNSMHLHSRVALEDGTLANVHAGDKINNPILEAIVDIPGVILAIIQPYSVQVQKARPFSWSEIELPMSRLLKSFNASWPDTTITEEDANE